MEPEELRRLAEKRIKSTTLPEIQYKEMEYVIHELRTHQIELEMQNEELRKSQLDLKESLELYSDLYHSAPIGYITLDNNYIICDSNEAIINILKNQNSTIINIPFTQIIADEDQDYFYHLQRRLRETKLPQSCDIRLKTSSGEYVRTWIDCNLTLDTDENIKLIRVAIIDITERYEYEVKQKQLQKQLQQAQKMEAVGQLTGGIAHDFNNALTTILGYTQMGMNDLKVQKIDKLENYLQQVYISGQRAADMVKKLLAFSRNSEAEYSEVDLVVLVSEVFNLLKPMLPSSMSLRFTHGKSPLFVLADPVQLHQILINLCINARDAITTSGAIDIELNYSRVSHEVCSSCHESLHADFVELIVRDSGSGIKPEIVESIFDPFFTTKPVGEGTGMGLSMVHGIVHQHQGHIIVRSTDNGTVFRLLFPIVKERVNKASRLEISSTNESSEHVMIVDDDDAVAQFFATVLESNGFHVTIMIDSQKALELFLQDMQAFDLIVTDHIMPTMTGYELSKEILSHRPDIPIVMCTGFSSTIDNQKAKELGIREFMMKPVDSKLLMDKISQLLKTG